MLASTLSEVATLQSAVFITQLAEVAVAGATGLAATKGYRETGSPTFLRLGSSFVLLSVGILAQALAPFVPGELAPAFIMVGGSALEAVGYFILALSHFFTVRQTVVGLAGILVLAPFASEPSIVSLDVMVKAVSLYLLLYVSAETLIFYFQYRNPPTLISVAGLVLLTVGMLLKMFVSGGGGLSVLFEAVKLAGFVVLFSPVGILLRRRQVAS